MQAEAAGDMADPPSFIKPDRHRMFSVCFLLARWLFYGCLESGRCFFAVFIQDVNPASTFASAVPQWDTANVEIKIPLCIEPRAIRGFLFRSPE